jgi:ABC-2 type transport system ATP-binding protein
VTAIAVHNLSKYFYHKKPQKGFWGTLAALVHPEIEEQKALDSISFEVDTGEKLAFIGPNGAGKSTTIKILTGILHPDAGSVRVLDFHPFSERKKLSYYVGTVFGGRTQLGHNLPARSSFDLLATLYELEGPTYRARLGELAEIFELRGLLEKPPKTCSLGERMRLEIAASLLHKPKILFLDEPTVGLDLNAKLHLRTLLNRLAKEEKVTLFLTSHDTIDIEEISDRVLIIDRGRLALSGTLEGLKKKFTRKKVLTLTFEAESKPFQYEGIKILERIDNRLTFEIDTAYHSLDRVIHEIMKTVSIKDLTIEDPSLEEIIRDVYASGLHA